MVTKKIRVCKLCGRRLGNTTFTKCSYCRAKLQVAKNKVKVDKKHSSKTYLDKQCVDLWSLIVRRGGKCEICGATKGLQAHHVVGKRNKTLRHDPRNGCCLCSGHHKFFIQSAHEDPQWFLNEWFAVHRTEDYNYIWEKKKELSTNMDINFILEVLRGYAKEKKA